MPLGPWKILPAASLLLLSVANAQNYYDLSATVNGPWHHMPNPRSALDFNKEIAKCRVVAAQTPVNSTTPAIIEIIHFRVIINCLKAAGYEPGPRSANTAGLSKEKPHRHRVKMAGFGPGIQKCSVYISNLGKDEDNYLSWAAGFMTAWNIQSKEDGIVELSALPFAQQIEFLRNYCTKNEDKMFADGVVSWPAPGSEDTKLGVLMELEVGHGETEVYAGVQA